MREVTLSAKVGVGFLIMGLVPGTILWAGSSPDPEFKTITDRSQQIETLKSKHSKALVGKETKVSGKRTIDFQPRLLCLRQVSQESKRCVTQIRIQALRKDLRLTCNKIDSPEWLRVQEDLATSDDSGLLTISVQAAKVMQEGIHAGRIQIHLEGLAEAVSVPVFLFANVDEKTDTSETSLAVLKALGDMFRSKPLRNEDSGRGTARVRNYDKGKLTENRLLHFRFKDRLSRSDYYTLKENQEKQFICTWSVHRKGSLTYNHYHVLGIIPHPAAEFYRQVGYDFCPDTYNRLYGLRKPIHEQLFYMYEALNANKGILGCHMDDNGVLHFAAFSHKTKDTDTFAFDTQKEYRLVSYYYTFPQSIKVEWIKYGESGWYIRKATFEEGPWKTEVEIQDFQFADDIADSEFTAEGLNIPMGATVVDKIRNTHYRYGDKPKLK